MTEGIVGAVRRREASDVARQRQEKAEEAEASQRRRVDDERRYRSQAQRRAMEVTSRMTGRVVFPARWATTIRKNDRGFDVVDAREVLEGKIEIVVTVNVAGGTVAQVQVGRPDVEAGLRWTRPHWADSRTGPEPLPDAAFFHRAVIAAGVK